MPVNDLIFQRLQKATDQELCEICEALQIENTVNINHISSEYRKAASHLFAMPFRDKHELQYKRILIGVAEQLKTWTVWPTGYKLKDETSEIAIEEAILAFIQERVEKEMKALSKERREIAAQKIKTKLESAGYKTSVIRSITSILISGTIGTLGAAPVTFSIFYSSFFASIWASILGPSSFLLLLSGSGIGLLAVAPLLAASLGGANYKKTIPATFHLILIRKRLEEERRLLRDIEVEKNDSV